jgi:hypothetical protein
MDIFFCGKIYEAQRSCSIRTEKHNSELRDAVSGFWVQRINFSIEKIMKRGIAAYSARSRTGFRLIANSVPIHPEQHSD